MHNVFHATLLSPYCETEQHGPNYIRPPPNNIDQHEEWEIERILRHRKFRNGTYKFQILWKGYPIEEASWEFEDDLENAPELLLDYKNSRNLA